MVVDLGEGQDQMCQTYVRSDSSGDCPCERPRNAVFALLKNGQPVLPSLCRLACPPGRGGTRFSGQQAHSSGRHYGMLPDQLLRYLDSVNARASILKQLSIPNSTIVLAEGPPGAQANCVPPFTKYKAGTLGFVGTRRYMN
jgi:hypothetical protein